MPNFFTPIATGAPVNADVVNDPLTELDNAITAIRSGITYLSEEGCVGDGVTDDTAAFVAALANGGLVMGEPGAVYRVTDQLPLVSNTILDLQGATILVDTDLTAETGNALLYIAGTSNYLAGIALLTNHAAGAWYIETSDGENWTEGDWIVIESEDVYTTGATSVNPKEVHQVHAVDGDNVYLDGPLVWEYTTANNAAYYPKAVKENIVLRNLKITWADPENDAGYSIRLQHTVNVRLENITIEDAGGGIDFYGVHNALVTNYVCRRLPWGRTDTFSSFGYGIFLDDTCSNVVVNGGILSGCRHAVSTVFEQSRAGANWGGPVHCTFANLIGIGEISGLPIFDTHEGGRYLTFDNCKAIGAYSDGTFAGGNAGPGYGFQVRMQYNLINNCISTKAGDRGINVFAGADYCSIVGGEVSFNALNGVSLSAAHGKIIGTRVHHNGNDGIVIGSTGDDCVVQDCEVADNCTASSAYAGIAHQGGARTLIIGNHVPAGSSQTKAFSNLPADAVVSNNYLVGHTASTAFNTSGTPYAFLVYPQWNYSELLPQLAQGSGTPEGNVTARIGSLYVRRDGGASTTLYVKESGTGNTGWVAK